MSSFTIHTETSAPDGAREFLSKVREKLRFVPNLMGVLAEAPAALEGYLTLSALFESSSLSPVQRNVVLLAASRANGCEYCLAAHSGLARMQGMPEEVVIALREGHPITDGGLEALRLFTEAVTKQRGRLSQQEVEALFAAGFSRRQALEVILGVTQKTLSNYVNHLADTPLDPQFAAHRRLVPSAGAGGEDSTVAKPKK